MLKNEGKLLPPFRLSAIKISNLFEQNLKSIKKDCGIHCIFRILKVHCCHCTTDNKVRVEVSIIALQLSVVSLYFYSFNPADHIVKYFFFLCFVEDFVTHIRVNFYIDILKTIFFEIIHCL